jgi:hypothetical protein
MFDFDSMSLSFIRDTAFGVCGGLALYAGLCRLWREVKILIQKI